MPWEQGFLNRQKGPKKPTPATGPVSQPQERLKKMSPRILEPRQDAIGAAAVLKDAFEEDPVLRALLPGDLYEHAGAFHRKMVEMYSVTDLVYVLENEPGDVTSVALWNLPDMKKKVRPDEVECIGMEFSLWLLSNLGLRAVVRWDRYTQFMTAATDKHGLSDAYHLEVIGTANDVRGRGAGSAIMAPMLARADAERMPCVLVSANPKNFSFYKRHGFNVVAEEKPFNDWSDIPGDGPVVSFLHRSPAATIKPAES